MQHMYTGPLWRRERRLKREDRQRFAVQGATYPTLKQVGLVELDAIYVPDWARAKAVKGLPLTASSVWLRRIAANKLANLDREAGGEPKLTLAWFRRCMLCGRACLGAEAENRLALDRKVNGSQIPCGPDCLDVSRAGRGGRKNGRTN
jgi:hypothetical protein